MPCNLSCIVYLAVLLFPSDSLTEDGRGAGGDQGVQQVWGGHCGEGYEGKYVRISVYLIICLSVYLCVRIYVNMYI